MTVKSSGSEYRATMKYNPLSEKIIEELRKIVGADHVSIEDSVLRKYAKDQVDDPRYAHPPEAVVKPGSAEEVAAILHLANRERFPVTPRGAGSGLSGGAVPLYGGVSLSLERMDRIIEIDTANMAAVLEPGVVTARLDGELAPLGLFFAGYPMSEEFCFIGGNVAENAGGGRAVKYGVTGRYVIGLQVVTPTGEIMRIGGKRVKDVTGYDLVKLMVGSEGTLGIFTEITVRLSPRPVHRKALVAIFPDTRSAIAQVSRVMAEKRVVPAAVEYMDRESFSAACASLGDTLGVSVPERGAAMLFETDGTDGGAVSAELKAIAACCSEGGARAIVRSESEADRLRFWAIRKRVPWVLKRMTPYQSAEDIVVPVSAIPELTAVFEAMSARYGIPVPAFGHAGDGNIHAHPMKPETMTVEEWEGLIPEFLGDLYRRTAALGGTVSGEHGIGHKRKGYMDIVTDPAALEMMRAVKRAVDPNGILNPGKIFDL